MVLAAALAWTCAVAVLLLNRAAFIYPFDTGRASPDVLPRTEARYFTAADGTPLSAWIAAPSAEGRDVILYFMGNSGNLGDNAPRLTELLLRGYGLAALEYRGGAGRPGTPGEAALLADALALYDALDDLMGQAVAPGKRVIYGTSLGTGLAIPLAASRDAAALVLETPFDRLCHVAEDHFPIFPACLLMWADRYDSIDMAPRLDLPVLVLHGSADTLITPESARRLFDALPGPKRLIVYDGGNHNDLRLFGAGIDIADWLRSIEN